MSGNQDKLNERICKKLADAKAAEAAVIASVILDNTRYDETKTKIGPYHFGHIEHRIIWQVIQDLFEEGKAVDGFILRERLQEIGQLEKVGGIDYLQKILNSCPSAANCKYYTEIVKEQTSFRRLVEIYGDLGRELESEKPTIEIRTAYKQTIAQLDGDIIGYDSIPTIRNLAGVEVKPISWLWPYYFPMGMLSIIQGNAGLGKSMLTQKIMAIITTGGNWPNCNGYPASKADIGRVLILDAENPAAQVIKPRLVAMGADVSKIDILEWVTFRDEENRQQQDLFNLQRDITSLQQGIKPDTKAIFIDPITAFLGGGLDSNSNSDVRRVLMPLCELAEQTGIAIIGVTHLNKNAAGRAIHRGLGSVGFTAAARAVWQVTDDPTDSKNGKRLLTPAKINICAEPAGLVFSIDNGVLTFEGETELSADEALQGSTVDAPILKKAIDWIQSVLTPGNSMTFKELSTQAKAAGITESALRRAKKPAGVISYELQVDGRNQWFCRRDN